MTLSIGKNAIAVFGIAVGCVLAFQNCSDVSFSQLEAPIKPLSCEPLEQEAMEPVLLWDWKAQLGSEASDFAKFDQVMSSPMVADLEQDGAPEVVFVSWSNDRDILDDMTRYFDAAIVKDIANHRRNGVLRIVQGTSGKTKRSIGELDLAPVGDHSPLLVDLDKDGTIEIVYPHYSLRKIIALNFDGSFRWQYEFETPLGQSYKGFNAMDIDQDGFPEITVGPVLITEVDLSPKVKVQFINRGMNLSQQVGISLTRENKLQIVDGAYGVYESDGNLKFAFEKSGNTGIGDLIASHAGLEVAVVTSGVIRIYGAEGNLLNTIDLNLDQGIKCKDGNGNDAPIGGGTISIANFDGNALGRNQMAIATGRYFSIIDSDGKIVAKSLTKDCSSKTTGITTFDFNGDKMPEILYGDEQYFRVYYFSKNSLQEAIRIVNPSGTLSEYPVVADITGDGSSEILVAANNYVVSDSWYSDPKEVQEASQITGVRAFTAKNKRWMPTRPIWNQFDYIPGNINNRGQVSSSYTDTSFEIVRRNAIFEGQEELVCSPPEI